MDEASRMGWLFLAVESRKKFFAAEIYKAYLYRAAKIIRHQGGVITAYDGDRIMAVFIGDNKNSQAAETGLRISYAVTKIIQPALSKQYPKESYVVKQTVGVDRSELWVARTGIRGNKRSGLGRNSGKQRSEAVR